MSLVKEVEALTHFVWGAINRVFRGAANEFVDGHWLKLALHADEVKFAKDVTIFLGGRIGGFVNQDMRAVVFVQPFQT